MGNLISIIKHHNMNTNTAGNTAQYGVELFEEVYKFQPDFVPDELERIDKFMDKKIPGMRAQQSVCLNLQRLSIMDYQFEFTNFAVKSGLATRGCSKSDLCDELVIETDWYLTGQGKTFIN